MQKIQVLIDYSKHDPTMWLSALRLAGKFDATIYATHIFHPDYLEIVKELALLEGNDADDQFENFIWLHEEIEKERMQKFIDELTPVNFRHIPIIKIITYGYPVIEMLRMQEEQNFDLVDAFIADQVEFILGDFMVALD